MKFETELFSDKSGCAYLNVSWLQWCHMKNVKRTKLQNLVAVLFKYILPLLFAKLGFDALSIASK